MEVLFARAEHGGHKVVPLLTGTSRIRGLEVWWPEGPKKYPSNRQALIALVNRTPDPTPGVKDPKTSFDRYFRRGKYQRESYPDLDILSIFRPDESLAACSLKSSPLLQESSEELAILPKRGLGIDLAKRGHEVRKLFYAGFARRVFARGYDPEDVLQELYKALLIRNRGKCPWDPLKSSFGHYVHMVAGCIISNYNRRYGRLEKNEVFGVPGVEGELIDVSASDLSSVEAEQEEVVGYRRTREEILGLVLMEAPNRGISQEIAEEVFDLISDGTRSRDLKKDLPYPPHKLTEAVKLVQEIALLWKVSQ